MGPFSNAGHGVFSVFAVFCCEEGRGLVASLCVFGSYFMRRSRRFCQRGVQIDKCKSKKVASVSEVLALLSWSSEEYI